MPDETQNQPDSIMPADAPWWARWAATGAREAWKWASVRWSAFVAIAAEGYAANADAINIYVQHEVPAHWWPHIVAIVSLASLFFRVTNLKGAAK